MMPTPVVFNSFKEAVAEGVHDLGSDTLKVALTNTAPSVSNTVLADITQIASTGTYAPATATVTSSAQAGGTYSLTIDAVTFTASGADYAEFRYGVLYNDTAASDELICYFDYGTGYILPDGQSFTINAGTWLQNA